MSSFDDDYATALYAAGKEPDWCRYGYLHVLWRDVKIHFNAYGEIVLGEADELVISRLDTEKSERVRRENMRRIRSDAERILGVPVKLKVVGERLILSKG